MTFVHHRIRSCLCYGISQISEIFQPSCGLARTGRCQRIPDNPLKTWRFCLDNGNPLSSLRKRCLLVSLLYLELTLLSPHFDFHPFTHFTFAL